MFNNAKKLCVVVTGGDKAEAVSTVINKLKSFTDFPACGVRTNDMFWLIDDAAAALLEKS